MAGPLSKIRPSLAKDDSIHTGKAPQISDGATAVQLDGRSE